MRKIRQCYSICEKVRQVVYKPPLNLVLSLFEEGSLNTSTLVFFFLEPVVFTGQSLHNFAHPLLLAEPTLQRQNAENLKQIYPEKDYLGLSPNFHIHVTVSELYIPTMVLPIVLQEICGPILGLLYKSLTDKRMWKLGLRPRNSQKRNT
jgi:hypothetical protein